MADTLMLTLDNACLSYKGQVLFQDLHLQVQKDEWLAILGKSGVGKTSLLRMIAGLPQAFPEVDTVLSGKVAWQGGSDLHDKIAYMAQQDGLLPWLSVIDNIVVAKSLGGHKVDRVLAKTLLSQVGLAAHLDKKPGALSGGMRQRVALARTLLQDKPILLMDEPFSALDALTRLEMQNLCMQILRPRKQMLIMVTHDPWEALRLADRVVVLTGVPARFGYEMILPKADGVRELTGDLVRAYTEILQALGGERKSN